MCGICGYVGKSNPEKGLLRAMTDIMSYRGPDGSGTYCDEDAALGFRRLSIIDIESGNQPMYNEDKTVFLVFNGEIYNYRELRRRLIACGHKFATFSDSEVIVHAYEEFGELCVNELNGMFAFAIWDKKSKILLLARDRIGIKPLYYTFVGKELIFASEIKCLLLYPGVMRNLNFDGLGAYFVFSFIPGEDTMFKRIFRLKPGHLLTFRKGMIKIRSYWKVASQENFFENKSVSWYIDELKTELSKAVKRKHVSDVRLGYSLSGGIDSSSIIACTSKIEEKRPLTFTIGYNIENDEFYFARLLAHTFNTSHHEEIIAFPDITEKLKEIIWHLEEPSGNYVSATTFYLSKFISKYVKSVLIGEGSDELFGGYTRYKIFSPLVPLLRKGARFALFIDPGYCAFNRKEIHDLCKKNIDNAMDRDYLLAKYYFPYFNNSNNPFYNALRFELDEELPNYQLNRIDKLMMAHSVEARVPFLDHEFVEFCMRIPNNLKLRGITEKYILRQAMRDVLPEKIVRRGKGGKHGSQYILHSWFDNGLLNYARDILSQGAVQQRGYFEWSSINSLFKIVATGSDTILRRRAESRLYLLLVFELWQQVFLDSIPKKLGR